LGHVAAGELKRVLDLRLVLLGRQQIASCRLHGRLEPEPTFADDSRARRFVQDHDRKHRAGREGRRHRQRRVRDGDHQHLRHVPLPAIVRQFSLLPRELDEISPQRFPRAIRVCLLRQRRVRELVDL
jgi:hypothetical protein